MTVAPLTERIESTNKHDPYINVKFIEMFDHPDNAGLARAFTVGLAINDPEPVDEDESVDMGEGDILRRVMEDGEDDGLVSA